MIKNNIISISGEPVTGKSSNIQTIKQKLMENGYKEENIHIISAGHQFRDYFNSVLNFILNINDDKKIQELSKDNCIQTIIKNPKYKSDLIRIIANLKSSNALEHISIEQANNMPELQDLRFLIDTIIDTRIYDLGQNLNQKDYTDEFWIVDSRLAFKNIPHSFSVRLTCRPDIAGKRLFNDKSRGKEDNDYKNIEDAIAQREKRKNGEISRYLQRYNIDLTDENNYNLIIDTSFSNINDISNTILTCFDRYKNNQTVAKKWASPKQMLPLQRDITTCRPSFKNYSIDDMRASITKNGYDQNYPIEVVEYNNKKYIIEGHHRNFAAAYEGNTLVPYEVLSKDDDPSTENYYGGCSPKRIAQSLSKDYLYGHEFFLDKITDGGRFSYKQIYPDIFDEIDKNSQEIELD